MDMYGGEGADGTANGDDDAVVAGMRAKSEEFKAQGAKVYLPVVD